MSLKEYVLTELENNRDRYVSGQELADRFGVSRCAVWKAINTLRDGGYDIESNTHRGYRLSPDCDRLAEEPIRAVLTDKSLPVYVLPTVDSTNAEAKRILSQQAAKRFLVVAEEQTAGRGRLGRGFYSPKAAGLYMTLVMSPDALADDVVGMTSFAAVCTVEAIQELTGKTPQIKWVNDLYLDGKKITGILTEAVSDVETGMVSHVLVGIGVDLRPCEVPEELKGVVGNLDCRSGIRNPLAAGIANRLLTFGQGMTDAMNRYRKYSLVLGKDVYYTKSGREYRGRAVDIDDRGALVVHRDDGSIDLLQSGEISLRVQPEQ